jgi:hypothetical protein
MILNNHVTDVNKAVFDADNNFRGSIAGALKMLRRSGLLEEVRLLDPEESLSPRQLKEIDRVYKMYPHLRDDDFINRFINEWFNDECVGYDTLKEFDLKDLKDLINMVSK